MKMSDSEDNAMNVDGASEQAMQFSSKSTENKGKRSAANLPVELQDALPWVEKYRPQTLEDVYGHQDILATINKFVETNRLPHLLLYGPPGTGKTSTILALARRIYGTKNMRQMVLELNASDDRGIDVVREQIKTFSSTKQIFNSFGSGDSKGNGNSLATFKLIILDEADAMTSTAQMALRRIMERYTPNTRFCIIANYSHKLSPAVLSRCTRFRFSPLPDAAIRSLIEHVISSEDVRIAPDATDALVHLSKGDCRRALNVLQACHASTLPMPGSEMPVERDSITADAVYDCVASPHPADIETIRDTLLSTSDVASCLNTIKALRQQRGLAIADVIEGLSESLMKLQVPPQTRILWCEGLAEVEARMAGGGNENIQMGGLVGVVRHGVEAMEKTGMAG